MKKRLLVCLACCALILGGFAHASALSGSPAGDAATTAAQPAEHAGEVMLAKAEGDRAGCMADVEQGAGGCSIDAVAPSNSIGAPDRSGRVAIWIETISRLKTAALSPQHPPPISAS